MEHFDLLGGVGKKVILADVLAESADLIFNMQPETLTIPIAWFGAIAYTLQIYFDFSGYSDMAIGLGRIFGFTFPENFKLPYISKSVKEFWRRWHISLSSWFKDYLYIPLGGNRTGNVYINLIIVFLCTGIWHGAAVTFIFWGLWHGLFLIIERIMNRKDKFKMPYWLGWIYTELVVVIGWVLFRSDSMGYALGYLKAMAGLAGGDFNHINIQYFLNARTVITVAAASLISLGIPKVLYSKISKPCYIKFIDILRFPVALLVFGISLIMVVNGNYSPFIYFRF